jgi:hypothetical protein
MSACKLRNYEILQKDDFIRTKKNIQLSKKDHFNEPWGFSLELSPHTTGYFDDAT